MPACYRTMTDIEQIKTLLTRGQKGCFVYCEDEALRAYFKRMAAATDG